MQLTRRSIILAPLALLAIPLGRASAAVHATPSPAPKPPTPTATPMPQPRPARVGGIGFFGAQPAPQPQTTAGHGSVAGKTYGPREQAMLGDVFTALEQLGLLS